MTHLHYIGLDLGQSFDYTAVAVVEPAVWLTGDQAEQLLLPMGSEDAWHWPSRLSRHQTDQARGLNYWRGRPPDPPLSVPHLERFPLGTSYPTIVEQVAALLRTPPLRPELTALVVDKTGVGAPVVDMLRRAGLAPVPVTITGGSVVAHDPEDGFRVPKRDLVSTVAVLLEQKRLKVAEALPAAGTLADELQAFKRTVTKTGHDSYGAAEDWRRNSHDDLVLAVALACWYRNHFNELLDQQAAQLAGARA